MEANEVEEREQTEEFNEVKDSTEVNEKLQKDYDNALAEIETLKGKLTKAEKERDEANELLAHREQEQAKPEEPKDIFNEMFGGTK